MKLNKLLERYNMSHSNPNLSPEQAKQLGESFKKYYNGTQSRAIVYKDWNQIANVSVEGMSREEAISHIEKSHTNIKQIKWY